MCVENFSENIEHLLCVKHYAGCWGHSAEKNKPGSCPPRACSLIETQTVRDGTTVQSLRWEDGLCLGHLDGGCACPSLQVMESH